MDKKVKREMKTRTRLAQGLLTVLEDDLDQIVLDVDNGNMFTIDDSIKEAKNTIQKLTDDITELEYVLYLSKQDDSRNLQSLL